MSGQFERFRPLKEHGEGFDFFGTSGISPEEAGRQDAKAAMQAAKAILEEAARALKESRSA